MTQKVALRYGAESKPGVETGTGRSFSPPSGLRRSSPVMTTSWQRALLVWIGGIGCAIASIQRLPMSSTSARMPSE